MTWGGGGGGGGSITCWGGRYTFLSVEQDELDRNLAPSQMGLAAQHMMLPRAGGGLNGKVHVGIVILSVVHVLQTFHCGCIVGQDPGVECSAP